MSSIWKCDTRQDRIISSVSLNQSPTDPRNITVILRSKHATSTLVLNRSLAIISSPKFRQLLAQCPLSDSAITIHTSACAFHQVLNYMHLGQEWKFSGDPAAAFELLKLSQFLELEELTELISSQLTRPSLPTETYTNCKLQKLENSVYEAQTASSELKSMQETTQNVILNLKMEQNLALFDLRTELQLIRHEIREMKCNYELQLQNSQEELQHTKIALQGAVEQLEAQKKIQNSSRVRTLDLEAEVRNNSYQLNLTRMEVCDLNETLKDMKQTLQLKDKMVQSQSENINAQAEQIKKLQMSSSKNWECLQKHLKENEKRYQDQSVLNQCFQSIALPQAPLHQKELKRLDLKLSEAISSSEKVLADNKAELERMGLMVEKLKIGFEEQKSRLNRKSGDIYSLSKNLVESKKRLDNVSPEASFPKGFLYFQFPLELEPNKLWPELKWMKTDNRLDQFCACGEFQKGAYVNCKSYYNTNLERMRGTCFNPPDPTWSPVSPKLGSPQVQDGNIVVWRRC